MKSSPGQVRFPPLTYVFHLVPLILKRVCLCASVFVCVCVCVCVFVFVFMCTFVLAVINLQLERKEWGLNLEKGTNPPSLHIRTYICLEPGIR